MLGVDVRKGTREGMVVARANGKLKGKKPKLSPMQSKELCLMYETGDYSISDLSDVFQISADDLPDIGATACGA